MSPDTWNGRLPLHAPDDAEAYVAAGAWTDRTTIEQFRVVALQHPDRDAVVGPDGVLTYSELDVRSDQIAAAMMRDGVRSGDPVLLQLGNSAEGVLAMYAVLKLGAVPVATLTAHRSHEILHIGALVGATTHIVDASVNDGALVPFARDVEGALDTVRHLYTVGGDADGFGRVWSAGVSILTHEARDLVDRAQLEIDPRSVAAFQLSGGTTGTPKVIPRLHAEYWNNAATTSASLGRDKHCRIAHALPFVHNAGMVHAVFGAHCVGGCVIVLPFGPTEQCLDFLVQTEANDMMIAGPMAPWVDHPTWEKFAVNLKRLIFAGSKAPQALFDRVSSLGTWVGQVWGMAEGPYTTTDIGMSEEIRRHTVGTPNIGSDSFRIVDADTGLELPDGATGVLTYTGPSTLAGYFDADEHNAVAFRYAGYFDTGDLAKVVTVDGVRHLSIEGRIKDVINRGGEKISTEEVEKLLLQHPDVVEAAVVAMPDARLVERSCAYVAVTPGAPEPSLGDIQAHFEALGVAKFKWPERIEVISSLPRTNTLKIDKKRLRAHISDLVKHTDERSLHTDPRLDRQVP